MSERYERRMFVVAVLGVLVPALGLVFTVCMAVCEHRATGRVSEDTTVKALGLIEVRERQKLEVDLALARKEGELRLLREVLADGNEFAARLAGEMDKLRAQLEAKQCEVIALQQHNRALEEELKRLREELDRKRAGP